jgi:DNA-binding MarR family transcriptional regulator
MKELFIKDKQASIIMSLGIKSPQNILDICKKTEIVYAYTHGILKELENAELVYSEKSGRERYYRLTDAGKEVYQNLSKFMDNMDKIEYGQANITLEEQKLLEYKQKIEDLKAQLKGERMKGTHSSQKLDALLDQLTQIEAQL